jgi:hypothetical protein
LIDRRKQEGNALRVVYDGDLERRVRFLQNAMDATFGFVEEKFCELENGYWMLTGNGRGSRLSTLDDAIREATRRVEWLGSALD